MPDLRYKTCKGCGRPASEVGELSWTRLCIECFPVRQREHNEQMHNHAGPIFREWRRKMARSIGAVLAEDLDSQP